MSPHPVSNMMLPYFSIAVIKHCDQESIFKKAFNLGLIGPEGPCLQKAEERNHVGNGVDI